MEWKTKPLPRTIIFEPSEWWDFNGKGLLHLGLATNKASGEGPECLASCGNFLSNAFAHVGLPMTIKLVGFLS